MFILFNSDPDIWRKYRSYIEPPKTDGTSYEASLQEILSFASRGYQTGLNWTDTYKPGGPFVTGMPHLRERDKLCTQAWWEGFNQGIKRNTKLASRPT